MYVICVFNYVCVMVYMSAMTCVDYVYVMYAYIMAIQVCCKL